MSGPSGTLFVGNGCRNTLLKALIRYYKLDVSIKDNFSKEYLENFPIHKTPGYIGKDGLYLHEAMAIIYYFLSFLDTDLLGKTKEDYAEIMRWVSFANSNVIAELGNAFAPLLGRVPYNKKAVDQALETSDKYLAIFEKRLTTHSYLVGERLTLADYFAATIIHRGYAFLWGKEWIAAHPAVTRWFTTVTKQPLLAWFFENFTFRDEPLKFVPPKKEAKPKAEKKEQPKKKEAAKEPEEPVDDVPKEKKEVHPISLLGAAKWPIDEWKRTYSNKETREEALPWFWDHYDPADWSLWRVDYKYNDELTYTFMSNNLIGGFFNRLSGSIKYMFGCAAVCGENNANAITGAFLVRGQDYKAAFDVAPDWESYNYTQLDPSKPEDKAFIEDVWAWDKPIVIDGKSLEVADGKVLK